MITRIYIFYFTHGKTRSILILEAGTVGRTCGNRSETGWDEADGIGFTEFIAKPSQEEETASLVPKRVVFS
jgi:hypothetical protein